MKEEKGSALILCELSKLYENGFQALSGINLEVESGDFFALLGPNGAGKSTIIGIICSLIRKTSGIVGIFGYDTDVNFSSAKKLIGIVPQEFNFNQFEKPIDILVTQAGYYGITRSVALKRAKKYLSLLDNAIESHNYNLIGDIMHKILQEKNVELIRNTGNFLGTCENVLFVNDGSGRRYITKGEPGWDYISDDTPLDEATKGVIKKINTQENSEKYVNKKDRETITKRIKKKNDWNSHKDTIIGNIMGDRLSIEYALEQEDKDTQKLASSPNLLIIEEDSSNSSIIDKDV